MEGREMRRLLTSLAIIIVAFVGLAFAVLNSGTVELKYYLGSFSIPLALLLAITLLVGVILGGLASIALALRQRRENGRLRKHLALTEAEVKNLRELPIKDRQ
jgi:putative membrane protein